GSEKRNAGGHVPGARLKRSERATELAAEVDVGRLDEGGSQQLTRVSWMRGREGGVESEFMIIILSWGRRQQVKKQKKNQYWNGERVLHFTNYHGAFLK